MSPQSLFPDRGSAEGAGGRGLAFRSIPHFHLYSISSLAHKSEHGTVEILSGSPSSAVQKSKHNAFGACPASYKISALLLVELGEIAKIGLPKKSIQATKAAVSKLGFSIMAAILNPNSAIIRTRTLVQQGKPLPAKSIRDRNCTTQPKTAKASTKAAVNVDCIIFLVQV